MPKPGYHDRVIQHSLLWVNGHPKHNYIDDECVHDFSCCEPDLFTTDLDERRKSHQRLVERVRQKSDTSYM